MRCTRSATTRKNRADAAGGTITRSSRVFRSIDNDRSTGCGSPRVGPFEKQLAECRELDELIKGEHPADALAGIQTGINVQAHSDTSIPNTPLLRVFPHLSQFAASVYYPSLTIS